MRPHNDSIISQQTDAPVVHIKEEVNETLFLQGFNLIPVVRPQRTDSFDAISYFVDDAKVKRNTGIDTLENLWMIFRYLEDRIDLKPNSSSVSILPPFEQFCLTLMTLKLDLKSVDFMTRYKLSEFEVTKCIDKFLPLMLEFLVPTYIQWLKREDNVNSLFIDVINVYKKGRVQSHIELFNEDVQKCVCFIDLLRVEGDRNEEHWNYLIAFSPSGLVSFVSTSFPGSLGQMELLKLSGLLDHLSHEDRLLMMKIADNDKMQFFKCDKADRRIAQLFSKPLVMDSFLYDKLEFRMKKIIKGFKNSFLLLRNLLSTGADSSSLFNLTSSTTVDRLIKVCCALYNISYRPS